ncbi:TlpA disulfide reductase family protein [Altererythrobacter arenosus]|uniref:TlpA disulfide reductase family protein n=1 Tax=Altererythrobacter arenosus TaxID=3032592 RepID=A0ABY8FSE7_9SPHN|nr:TlpA disulfide reductase family protein [Altererythrobacter sp. CAU 1644]WFL77937.1 TlpA disulfide reductase family protein [Altererythrobacter sp. CAU 1644]
MSLRLSLTILASALLLAGCDREPDDAAQQQGELASDKQGLSGEIDRSYVGELMPAVEVVDPAGKTLNLGALQGKPVLLNLWATWCAPCVVEMPMLDTLADEMGDELRVITVSQDMKGAELVEPFFAERNFRNLEPWLDTENKLGFAFDGVLPVTVLYDAAGQEVFRVAGGYHWDSEEARVAIEEAISEYSGSSSPS